MLVLRPCFPGMPCYEQFVTIQQRAFVPLIFFLLSRMGRKTGIYLRRQHRPAGV
jgi:hypothetical protein